jgi:hypothetical protein
MEAEVRREPLTVPFHGFVEAEGRHAVEAGRIGTEDDSLAADAQDTFRNALRGQAQHFCEVLPCISHTVRLVRCFMHPTGIPVPLGRRLDRSD